MINVCAKLQEEFAIQNYSYCVHIRIQVHTDEQTDTRTHGQTGCCLHTPENFRFCWGRKTRTSYQISEKPSVRSRGDIVSPINTHETCVFQITYKELMPKFLISLKSVKFAFIVLKKRSNR